MFWGYYMYWRYWRYWLYWYCGMYSIRLPGGMNENRIDVSVLRTWSIQCLNRQWSVPPTLTKQYSDLVTVDYCILLYALNFWEWSLLVHSHWRSIFIVSVGRGSGSIGAIESFPSDQPPVPWLHSPLYISISSIWDSGFNIWLVTWPLSFNSHIVEFRWRYIDSFDESDITSSRHSFLDDHRASSIFSSPHMT